MTAAPHHPPPIRPAPTGQADDAAAFRGLTPDARVLALVPHYHCQEWLAGTLESLLAQTRPLDGIVVIDDASADPPVDIVSRYPQITLLRAEENVGPYRLVQQVIDATDHDAILFQDADDWSAPDRLERLLQASAATGAELVGSDYMLIDTYRWSARRVLFPLDANAALAARPTGHAQQHPAGLVARTLVDRIGGYATGMRFSGDDEFLRRAAHVARIVNVPRPLYHRRHRSDSLTSAAATGHGSPARQAVLAEMRARAHANRAAIAKGDPPDLTPLSARGPVELRHLSGPALQPAHAAARPRIDGRRPAAAAAATIPRTRQPSAAPAPPGAQILVVGAGDSAADAVACSLAQHPAIAYAGDVSWVAALGAGFTAAADTADGGHVIVPETRPGTQLDTLAATPDTLARLIGPALDATIIGGGHRDAADDADADAATTDVAVDASATAALRQIARSPLTAERRWVGTAPADPDTLARLVALLPDVQIVHVVRDVDEVVHLAGPEGSGAAEQAAAAWHAGAEALLDLERAVGTRVHRVRLHDLLTDPRTTLRSCIEVLGEEFVEALLHPFTAATPPACPQPHPGVPQTTRRLSDALLGPIAGGRRPVSPERAQRATGVVGASPEATAATEHSPAAASSLPQPASLGRHARATPLRRTPPVHPSVPAAIELVDHHVGEHEVVAVLSRGDDALLDFTATGWHLPRTSDGAYAGHHPADGADAVGHVEAARADGAAFLLVPSTSAWWLEHYPELQAHLRRAGRQVAARDGHLLFTLRDGRGDPPRGRQAAASGATSSTSRPAPRVAVPARIGAVRPKVQVITWSVSHNPYGRAHLLADVLADSHDVELIGATFDRFGGGVWPPLADAQIPLRTFPGGPFPECLTRMEEMSATLDGDAIIVSKPRMPGYGLGILAKMQRNRPLILDVDDHELAFVNASSGMSLAELRRMQGNPALLNPHGGPWTRYCDHLIGHADAVTVSNGTLQDVYGGEVIGHARDERVFDPGRWTRAEVRARFGFADDERIVLFGGTPRRHKGILDIAAALRRIGDPRLKLCLIETTELAEMHAELADFADVICTVPYQPMGDLPALVAAADLVCVLQDPTSPVARYQIPAKITDALAMQTPCLTTDLPPLADLAATGALHLLDGPLHEHIQAVFDDHASARTRAAVGRDVFLEQLSYAAVRPRLTAVVEEHLARPPRVPAEFRRAVAFQRELHDEPRTTLTPQRLSPSEVPRGRTRQASRRDGPQVLDAPAMPQGGPPATYDVVLFWKQNDTGIYGRRHDMLLEHMAHSPRVRRIVQFDHPIGVSAVQRLAEQPPPSHGALLHDQVMARLAAAEAESDPVNGGNADVIQRTFVYEDRDRGDPDRLRDPHPPRDAHLAFVRDTLAAQGVGSDPTVLWGYPKHFDLPDLIDGLDPDLVVMDVVDDHRTWQRGGAEHDRISEHYADVMARADLTLTNCAPMLQEMRLLNANAHMVPNGCQWPAPPLEGPEPEALIGLDGPIIGYVGNLSSRLDVALLDKVAQARPGWDLVLVGSTHAGRDALALDVHPNVHFLGPRPAHEARRFIDRFDVAIIPHVDDDMTRKMHPLKAFVYCSMGVPVVSTAIGNLEELRALVRVGDDADHFIDQVDAALCEGRRPLTATAEAILAANAWSVRMAHIDALIDDAWGRR